MRLASCLAAALTALAACGGSTTDPSGDDNLDEGGDAIALEALDARLGHAYCATLFSAKGDKPSACCTAEDVGLVFSNFPSTPVNLAECEALVAKHASVAQTIREAVDAGRARYDAAAAGDCVAAMEARPCDVLAAEIQNRVFEAPFYLGLSSVPLFCTGEGIGVIEPTATADTGCTEDFHCAAGSFCNREPHECTVVSDGSDKQDAECEGTAPDRNGVCRRANGQFAPKVCCEGVVVDCSGEAPPGKCEPLPAAGKSCNGACADGLACNGFPVEPTCVAKLPDGQPCFFPGECQNTCVKTELNGTGSCGIDAPVCAARP